MKLEETDGYLTDLRVAEEKHIREAGGLQKEGGPLENKIHAMSNSKYEEATKVDKVVNVPGRLRFKSDK